MKEIWNAAACSYFNHLSKAGSLANIDLEATLRNAKNGSPLFYRKSVFLSHFQPQVNFRNRWRCFPRLNIRTFPIF